MKLKGLALLTGALALQATSSAFAVNLDAECDIDVFISGASAQDNTLVAQVQNLMLSTGTIGATGVTNGSVFRGDEDNSWRLIIGQADNSKIAGGLSSTNPVLCVHKRSEGGSAWGVQPVVQNAVGTHPNGQTVGTPINFMLGVDCDAGTSLCSQSEVGESVLISPDAGLSDVEPAVFNGDNTPGAAVTAGEGEGAQDTALDPTTLTGMTASDVAGLEVFQQAMFPFGVGVNPEFYAALQVCQGMYPSFAAQAADPLAYDSLDLMPSLTHSQIVSLYTGFSNGALSLPCDNIPSDYVDAANPLGPGVINVLSVAQASGAGPAGFNTQVCRRVNGSGTHAQFRLKVLGVGCQSSGALDFATVDIPGLVNFIGNSGSSDMGRCMGGTVSDRGIQPTTTSWKIGFQATDKVDEFSATLPGGGLAAPAAGNAGYWRFIKVDGAAPTLANAAYGGWFDAVQATLQRRAGATAADRNYFHDEINGGSATDVENFLTQLIANFGDIVTVGGANFETPGNAGATTWFGGSLVINGSGCTVSGTGFDATSNPCSSVTHEIGTLNNCLVPVNNVSGILDSQ